MPAKKEEVQGWIYDGEIMKKQPEGLYGFTYKITDDTGKVYYGKKAFIHTRKTKLGKKARKGTKQRVRTTIVDSKWLGYWGSSKPLLAYITERGGTHGFKREMIKICANRASLYYWETALLIEEKVLFREDCWNGNVCGKFFKGKIHK